MWSSGVNLRLSVTRMSIIFFVLWDCIIKWIWATMLILSLTTILFFFLLNINCLYVHLCLAVVFVSPFLLVTHFKTKQDAEYQIFRLLLLSLITQLELLGLSVRNANLSFQFTAKPYWNCYYPRYRIFFRFLLFICL